MTFREGTREVDARATSAAPGAVTIPEEPETPVALGEEPEDTPRPEPLEAGEAPRGEDPVRLYLKEIGKVHLLTAAQEVQIGRRGERSASPGRDSPRRRHRPGGGRRAGREAAAAGAAGLRATPEAPAEDRGAPGFVRGQAPVEGEPDHPSER